METPLVDRALALVPDLITRRAEHDEAHRLAPAVVTALRDRGLYGVLVPRELGGHELSPRDYVATLEALARGDSATAWCVMTASTSTLLSAYLAREVAEEVWGAGRPAPVLAGVFAPTGKLAIDGERARLTGRWQWGSGCRHAEWVVVGALAERRHAVCVVRASEVTIVDNWDTLGLGGTGSHDLVIEDAELSTRFVTSVFDREPWPAGALYRVPLFGLLALGIAGCALGIARVAVDHVATSLPADAASASWGRYAELRARLEAARAYLIATADDADAAARARAMSTTVRGQLRLASCHVVETCVEVARGMFHLGGGSSVRTGSVLGAALRDLETVATHRMVTDRVRPAAVRAAIGVGTPPPDL